MENKNGKKKKDYDCIQSYLKNEKKKKKKI